MTKPLPQDDPRQRQPDITLARKELAWEPKVGWGEGLLKTIRYFEIESLAEASCIVSNGEYIGGLMGPRLGKRMARNIYRAFVDMNDALKVRAETLWLARKP